MLRWRICRKRRAMPGPTANPIAAIRVNEPLMNSFKVALPIDDALPALTAALAARDAAVLVAPPGAGKTTRVPLVLAEEPWAQGRTILVLEPRRIAARAAAERMARTLGEAVGGTPRVALVTTKKMGRR